MNQHLALWRRPCSAQRQARELISGPDLATGARLLSFNRTQTRAVIGLLTGHNTLRRHLHVMGLNDNPTCRKCGTEEETSAHILCECEALASLRHAHYVPFFWTRRILGCWGWGPSGTLLKEKGTYSLVQYWGHRGPALRPRCIAPGGARTPFIFLFYSNSLYPSSCINYHVPPLITLSSPLSSSSYFVCPSRCPSSPPHLFSCFEGVKR